MKFISLMANWASTSLVLTGDKKEINDLFNRMQRLEKMPASLIENSFGTTWLGNLVTDLGTDYQNVNCRGSWSDLERIDDVTIRFNTESTWYRCYEVDELIMKKYPSIDIIFRCEEEGMGIFETNDHDGTYFPERFMIDIENGDVDYYTENKALIFLEDFLGIDFKDMDEATSVIEQYNNEDKHIEERIWIHEFEIID